MNKYVNSIENNNSQNLNENISYISRKNDENYNSLIEDNSKNLNSSNSNKCTNKIKNHNQYKYDGNLNNMYNNFNDFKFELRSLSNINISSIINCKNFDNMLNYYNNVFENNDKNPILINKDINIIYNMLIEDFDNNLQLKLSNEEKKLVKIYQSIIQYVIYTKNYLNNKKIIIENLINQQLYFSNKADLLISKQKNKIKHISKRIHDIDINLVDMEILIKELNINFNTRKRFIKERYICNKDIKDISLNNNYKESINKNSLEEYYSEGEVDVSNL